MVGRITLTGLLVSLLVDASDSLGLRDWGFFRAEGAMLCSVDHCGRRFRLLFVGPYFWPHRIAEPRALSLRKHDCRHRLYCLCIVVGRAQLVHAERTSLSFGYRERCSFFKTVS